jgi:predicted ribosomally synthesized peptide with SipW-like signal peptide
VVSALFRSRALRGALVLGALAVAGVAASGTIAAFTSSVVTSDTQIAVGTLALTAVGNDLTFDSTPLAPGDAAQAAVRLRNSGNLPSEVALHRVTEASTSPGGCAIKDALRLKIVEDLDGDAATTADRRTVVDAALSAAPADIAIGDFAADERRTFEFTLRYVPRGGASAGTAPGANDNCFQSSATRQRFSWSGMERGA